MFRSRDYYLYMLVATYCLMWLVIFILPYFSSPEYSIVKNTTSQLGAQATPNAWIMNATFAALGIGTMLAGWNPYKGFLLHRVLLLIFGISLSLTGFFSHAPVDPHINYNVGEDELHSAFASITGFAFTLLAISTAFICERKPDVYLSLLVGGLASLLSFLMFEIPCLMGIWQRTIFITSFGWYIYIFASNRFK